MIKGIVEPVSRGPTGLWVFSRDRPSLTHSQAQQKHSTGHCFLLWEGAGLEWQTHGPGRSGGREAFPPLSPLVGIVSVLDSPWLEGFYSSK